MHVVHHSAFGVMRKTGTVARAHGVDGAHICFEIEKLTGLFYIHPIARPVLVQPLFPKTLFGHAQVGRYPPDVFLCIGGRHRLAAIGAIQAIGLRPRHLIRLCRVTLYAFGNIFLQPRQPAFHAPFVVTDDLPEGTQIYGYHELYL